MRRMKVVSVNTALAQKVQINGREVLTAIGKRPRSGQVAYRPMGMEGDEQADLSVHGGLSKAVYAYPLEHYAFWRTVRAQARAAGWEDELPPPGAMGENLTIDGLNERQLWIGDQLRFADGGVLVVSEPRFPCFKFNAAMGLPNDSSPIPSMRALAHRSEPSHGRSCLQLLSLFGSSAGGRS